MCRPFHQHPTSEQKTPTNALSKTGSLTRIQANCWPGTLHLVSNKRLDSTWNSQQQDILELLAHRPQSTPAPEMFIFGEAQNTRVPYRKAAVRKHFVRTLTKSWAGQLAGKRVLIYWRGPLRCTKRKGDGFRDERRKLKIESHRTWP